MITTMARENDLDNDEIGRRDDDWVALVEGHLCHGAFDHEVHCKAHQLLGDGELGLFTAVPRWHARDRLRQW